MSLFWWHIKILRLTSSKMFLVCGYVAFSNCKINNKHIYLKNHQLNKYLRTSKILRICFLFCNFFFIPLELEILLHWMSLREDIMIKSAEKRLNIQICVHVDDVPSNAPSRIKSLYLYIEKPPPLRISIFSCTFGYAICIGPQVYTEENMCFYIL